MIEFLWFMVTIEAALIVFLARHLRSLAEEFREFKYETNREVINLIQAHKALDAGLYVQAERVSKLYDRF